MADHEETQQKVEPFIGPEASQTFVDPALEFAARQLLGSYFGGPELQRE